MCIIVSLCIRSKLAMFVNEHAIYKINVCIHPLFLVSDISTKLLTSTKQNSILQIWTHDVHMLYDRVIMPVYALYSLRLLYGCFAEFVNNLIALAPHKLCILVTVVLLGITWCCLHSIWRVSLYLMAVLYIW